MAPAHLTALLALGDRLAQQAPPEDVLHEIVHAVAGAAPGGCVCIFLRDAEGGFELAAWNKPDTPLFGNDADFPGTLYPAMYQAEVIGKLGVTSPVSPEHDALLAGFAQKLGTAFYSARLVHDLSQSRERLVLMREEERRKLRRNLHNMIGPTLAGLNLRVRAVQKMTTQDPPRAAQQMDEVRAMISSVITDIRRVIYDLRPPALDELGLLPALREQTRIFTDERLTVTLTAPETIPPLSAAVEVALYRIAQETLSNVARHANAAHCDIHLTFGPDSCTLLIDDDGAGIEPNQSIGVGMSSMRELATELGGRCAFDRSPIGGLRVTAQLPIV